MVRKDNNLFYATKENHVQQMKNLSQGLDSVILTFRQNLDGENKKCNLLTKSNK